MTDTENKSLLTAPQSEYRIVPVEPTEEMLNNTFVMDWFDYGFDEISHVKHMLRQAYRLMIYDAPQQPSAQPSPSVEAGGTPTSKEPDLAEKAQSCSVLLMTNYQDLSQPEARVVANMLLECATALEESSYALECMQNHAKALSDHIDSLERQLAALQSNPNAELVEALQAKAITPSELSPEELFNRNGLYVSLDEVRKALTTHPKTSERSESDGWTKQRDVYEWAVRTFGDYATGKGERAMRLIEEAVELAQAIGVHYHLIEQILDRVYSRAKGEIAQELGGTAMTLLALAECLGLSAKDECQREFTRVLSLPAEHFRRKVAEKQAAGIENVSSSTVEPVTPAEPAERQ